MSSTIKFCYECNKEVHFLVQLKNESLHLKGYTVLIENSKSAYCPICNQELFIEHFVGETMKKAVHLWEHKSGKIFR